MAIKVLGLNGTHKRKKEESLSWYLLLQSLEALEELGCETEAVHLPDLNILDCEGCSRCMGGEECPLNRSKKDDTKNFAAKIREADALIYSYPTYGLHAPAILLKFIGGRGKAFLGEDLVVQGQSNLGEESLFRGKIVGIIVNAGGFGMEPALMTIWPALYASKAIVVASACISAFEYQKVGFIAHSPMGKPIENAEWAKMMCRGVGQRVYDALHSNCRPIIEGMMGIRAVKDDDEIYLETDKHGLSWTQSGWEEFNKIPVFAREAALEGICKNAKDLGFEKITREAIIEGRKLFAPQTAVKGLKVTS